MEKKIIALVQARTDSSRLPGKVLKHILGKPMIIHQLERIAKSDFIDSLILVTSDQASDDDLSIAVSNHKFDIFRGDKENVLKRFFDSLSQYSLNDDDIIVRLTGDCPLHDAKIIDESIVAFMDQDCDYLSNCITEIYPDGFDVEVFNYKSLRYAYYNARLQSQLEHVTPYIRDCGKFVINELVKTPIHNDWRLTVDEMPDFIVIDKIFNNFNKSIFSFENIALFIESNPEILNANRHIVRNEGYIKSLLKEVIK